MFCCFKKDDCHCSRGSPPPAAVDIVTVLKFDIGEKEKVENYLKNLKESRSGKFEIDPGWTIKETEVTLTGKFDAVDLCSAIAEKTGIKVQIDSLEPKP